MLTIQARVQDGTIIPREPLTWPNGTEVDVTLHPTDPDDIFDDTPESIARWFALLEATPFPTLTDAEWAAWQQRRLEDREWEYARAAEREKAFEAVSK